jgi:hypothetical protein
MRFYLFLEFGEWNFRSLLFTEDAAGCCLQTTEFRNIALKQIVYVNRMEE